ncbi:flagellar biosynthesis protein FlhA [Parendozoicomonas haliclonae]|uniref:Flagellar biosynthesis protein FlhA n=1 Tax=Parendozoicomonas haliclonae TaxID=1960125 RepID=A0A1X7AP01_9GAMM|nr:flagellar biosynthesis protein FlhA [Parendozoicomonas haliclonae]SMA49873.1 Flagellar biosynthesis protein FlhA [Parendozoicomonas haliclonae]
MIGPIAERMVGTRSELALVVAMLGILLVLFAPIPAALLDLLLLLNFSVAMLILLLTFFTDQPIKFSTFPSILLMATLLRLSLNIAATRLILSEGDAGEVIGAIGEYVVGGNYVIGLVVFCILIIVQYVVVTSGAQRVAEVAARFTLDSMPGKQMSIDADLNMGLIDEKEAQRRRNVIEKEANFYGSMDGASKFVKGDAIAGIIIILIDILGGLTVGIVQNGMDWGSALHTYTLMTVGDGIVTQIPALIISTATGIIITRAGSDSFLGDEVSTQISRYPKSLVLVSVFLLAMAALPGLPLWPIAILFCLFAAGAWLAIRASGRDQTEHNSPSSDADNQHEAPSLQEQMRIEALELTVAQDLSDVINGSQLLLEKIKKFREQYALEMGVILPPLKVKTNARLAQSSYEICLHGTKVGSAECYPGKWLAISTTSGITFDGLQVKDPSYGLPAVWVEEDQCDQARQQQYTVVDALTVLFTHISETIRRNCAELLTRKEVEALLEPVKASQPALYDELIPEILPTGEIQRVLQNLVREKVSIRHIDRIIETLADYGRTEKNADNLTEHVRRQLGRAICDKLLDDQGQLHVLTLDPALEQGLTAGSQEGEASLSSVQLSEILIRELGQSSELMAREGKEPVLVVSPTLRRSVKKMTERYLPHLTVLSLNEIHNLVSIVSFGIIGANTNRINVGSPIKNKEEAA